MKSTGRLLVIAGVAFAVVAAALAFVAGRYAVPAQAQDVTQPARVSQITVRGTGSISATPDTLRMTVGAAFQENTVKAAQDKASTTINAMVEKLKAAGIEEKDYRTGQYSVEPVMDYNGVKGGPSGTPVLTGFRVTNMLDITLRDTSKAADLLDQLVSAGANTVYNVSYTFANPDRLANQAYEGAVKDAETKATRLATLSNMTLGRLVSVTDANANLPGPVYKDGMGGGGTGPIFPGQQSVQTDLVVTYEVTSK